MGHHGKQLIGGVSGAVIDGGLMMGGIYTDQLPGTSRSPASAPSALCSSARPITSAPIHAACAGYSLPAPRTSGARWRWKAPTSIRLGKTTTTPVRFVADAEGDLLPRSPTSSAAICRSNFFGISAALTCTSAALAGAAHLIELGERLVGGLAALLGRRVDQLIEMAAVEIGDAILGRFEAAGGVTAALAHADHVALVGADRAQHRIGDEGIAASLGGSSTSGRMVSTISFL